MPKYRIKRFGNQFASCGVPLRPPPELIGHPSAKRLCPKLVPGQVVDLPEGHRIEDNELCERVRRVERDEILRPWVFATAEDAKMANPSRSLLSVDAIEAGLALAEGAIEKRARDYQEREARRAEHAVQSTRARVAEVGDGDEPLDDDDDYVPNPANRETADIYEDARDPDAEPDAENAKPERPARRRAAPAAKPERAAPARSRRG